MKRRSTPLAFLLLYVTPLLPGSDPLIDQQSQLAPALFHIGVVDGIFIHGFGGMFVGPILIGVFITILASRRIERIPNH